MSINKAPRGGLYVDWIGQLCGCGPQRASIFDLRALFFFYNIQEIYIKMVTTVS